MKREVFYKNKPIEERMLEDLEEVEGLTKGKSGGLIKALHFISIIGDKSRRNMGKRADYYSMSTAYLEEVFDSKFYQFLNPIVDDNIILKKETASADGGTTHMYAINPNYFKGQTSTRVMKIRYLTKKDKDLPEQDREALRDFKRFYSTLTINEENLLQTLYTKLDDVQREVYKLNERVGAFRGDTISYSNGFKSKRAKVWHLIKRSYKGDASLIQDGADYFFMKEDDYRKMKKDYLQSSWTAAIKDLVEGNLRAVRDKKGKREHTNLTNLPTELREQIFSDSGIVNEDLVNSQFAFYAMKARKRVNSLDADKFLTACEEGRVYELVQEELNLRSRGEAKQAMFLMNFSSDKYKSILKTQFKNKFPSIAKDISDYKNQFGSEAFPLMLQQTEADYILERVRPRLKAMGIISSSIHDSICVQEENSEVARKVMREVAQEIGLKAIIKEDELNQEIAA